MRGRTRSEKTNRKGTRKRTDRGNEERNAHVRCVGETERERVRGGPRRKRAKRRRKGPPAPHNAAWFMARAHIHRVTHDIIIPLILRQIPRWLNHTGHAVNHAGRLMWTRPALAVLSPLNHGGRWIQSPGLRWITLVLASDRPSSSPPASFFHVLFPLSPFSTTGSNLRGAFPRPCVEPTHSICLLSFPYFYSRRPVIHRRISEPISRGTTNTVAATTCVRDTVGLRNRDFTHRSFGSRCDNTPSSTRELVSNRRWGSLFDRQIYFRVLSLYFLVTGVHLFERNGRR